MSFTISKPAQGLYKEKGSKFISFAFPVTNEDDAKEQIAAIKKKYYDARHHCYAYVIGDKVRINNDREPSNTAGRPIYGQLLSKNLDHILLIVVRYFGGTKLGTGGLVQAYKAAATDALSNAEIVSIST
ncbi:hypothetical protein FACS1894153_1650 [Bacteroidia bacterium]|nr:hypothetical protein FACS1894153_1650 [Bacteroidia bacterium]